MRKSVFEKELLRKRIHTIGVQRCPIGSALAKDHGQRDVLEDGRCKHGIVVVTRQFILVVGHMRLVPRLSLNQHDGEHLKGSHQNDLEGYGGERRETNQ